MLKGHKGIIVIPFFILSVSLYAQTNSVSPYSRMGLGELYPDDFSRGLAIGKANIGLRDRLFINLSNPASYSQLALTTFEVGLEAKLLRQQQQNPDLTIENSTTGLRYFAVGIPFTDWWGTALALKPYSFRGYDITTQRFLADSTLVTDNFSGSGGINQVVWGNSFKVAKGLSLGINAAFVFGSMDDVNLVEWEGNTFDTRIEESAGLRGIHLKYGAQYQHDFSDGTQLGLGAYFSNSQNINADVSNYIYTISGNVELDTLAGSGERSGSITLPGEFGFGLSWGKTDEDILNYAWQVSADIELYSGSEYVDFQGRQQLEDAYRFQLGGYLRPKYAFEGLRRNNFYLFNVEYRLGGFYEQLPISLNGIQMQDYGITFGMGLPVKERNMAPGEVKVSTINMGIILGRRGTMENNLILENYLNIYLGFTLNDKWFIKYKYR